MRLIFVVLMLFGLSSCGFGGDKEKKAVEINSETAVSTNEPSEVYLEAEEWRGWAPPKQLLGFSLKRFVTDPFKLQGLNSTSAHYEKGKVFITVQLIDGSSDKGKREIRDHLAIAEMQRDHSSEYGYEKTLERNGIKAKEEYLAPPAGQYLIKFMLKEQYGVSVKSNAETSDEIWNFIDGLHLDALKQ
ncbi:MAG: hypothetical protein KJO53_13655 [Eudoraea sp.]|nr:hypothetical protein [Eudoraea sp.]